MQTSNKGFSFWFPVLLLGVIFSLGRPTYANPDETGGGKWTEVLRNGEFARLGNGTLADWFTDRNGPVDLAKYPRISVEKDPKVGEFLYLKGATFLQSRLIPYSGEVLKISAWCKYDGDPNWPTDQYKPRATKAVYFTLYDEKGEGFCRQDFIADPSPNPWTYCETEFQFTRVAKYFRLNIQLTSEGGGVGFAKVSVKKREGSAFPALPINRNQGLVRVFPDQPLGRFKSPYVGYDVNYAIWYWAHPNNVSRSILTRIGLEYVRFHTVFDHLLKPYKTNPDGTITPNSWEKLDGTIRDVLSRGQRPILCLERMPEELSTVKGADARHEPSIGPPISYKLYEKFIYDVVKHLVDVFGASEVQRWYFQVWNEPNGDFMKLDGTSAGEFGKHYLDTYRATVLGAVKALPGIRIGGPVAGHYSPVRSFLKGILRNPPMDGDLRSRRIDFVDWHLYVSVIPSMSAINRSLEAIASYLKEFPEVGRPELLISEFNTNGQQNGTLFNACFFLTSAEIFYQYFGDALKVLVFTDQLPYWYGQEKPETELEKWHYLWPVLSPNGLMKPECYALEMLKRMEVGTRVKAETSSQPIHVLAAVEPEAKPISLPTPEMTEKSLWPGERERAKANNVKPDPYPSSILPEDQPQKLHILLWSFEEDYRRQYKTTITLEVPNLPAGLKTLNGTVMLLDDDHANTKKIFIRRGKPALFGKPLLVGQINREASLENTRRPVRMIVSDGVGRIQLEMPSFSARLITFDLPASWVRIVRDNPAR